MLGHEWFCYKISIIKLMKHNLSKTNSLRYKNFIMFILFLVTLCAFLSIKDTNKLPPKSSDSSMHYDGYFPHPFQFPFHRVPNRVIVLRPEIADTLICLGAGDSIIAAYISPERRMDINKYRKYMPNAQILTRDLTKEEAIMMRPDFIIGWRGSFNFKSLGDPAYWNDRNVPTYIEENSGAMPDPYPPFKSVKYPPFSVENEIQFIENMARIFHKEEAAQREVAKIKKAIQNVKQLAKKNGLKTVLTMQFRRGQVEVLGDKTLSGDIIRKMGCKNLDYEGLLMPIENFLLMNPDCIIIIYDFVGGAASLKNQLSVLTRHPYNKLGAVKNERLGAMQYFDGLVATNVHTSQSIWEIYKAIYEPVLTDKLK